MNVRTLIPTLAAASLLFAQADVTLQRAIRKETLEGDLKGAIALYQKAVAEAAIDRATAAKALLRMAECHQKLGDSESRRIYERLVKEYADQKETAAQARTRLAAFGGGTASGVRTRLVWDRAIDLWGTVSADGRYVSFVNWPTLSPDIHDLATGENLRLWEKGGPEKGKGETGANAISPDGKRVAFAYLRWSGRNYDELHVINSDGSGHKVLLSGQGIGYLEPHSWSADGKWIACAASYTDSRSPAIVIVSAEDGKTRMVPTETKGWKSRVMFSPDGKWIAYSPAPQNAPPLLYMAEVEAQHPAEVKLLDDAQVMGWTPDGSGILFSRARAGAHHLYVLPVAQGRAAGEPQALYTASDVGDMPFGVTARGALFFGTYNRRADAAIYDWNGDARVLKEPRVSFPMTSSMAWLLGGDAVQYSRDGKRIAAVAPSTGFLVRDLTSGAERTITPTLAEWRRFQWGHDSNSLLILGRGADGKNGIYRVGLAGEPLVLVTENLPNNINNFVPSLDGKMIYYGRPDGVRARDLTRNNDTLLWDRGKGGPFQLKLSHDGKKLAIRAGDYLGVIDLRSGNVRDIQPGLGPKMTRPLWSLEWSADDTQLLTIVKMGMGEDKLEFWIYPASGGAPVKQGNVSQFRGLSLSPDGKHLATAQFSQRWQIWALENFLPAAKK